MAYKYTHFIPQNIAPKGATKIVAYNSSGEEIATIPLWGLTPPNKEKLYSFGLVSDIHLWHASASHKPNPKFEYALTYFENQGCSFCCISGDLTQTGFYRKKVESDQTEIPYSEDLQFETYQEICGNHPNLPIYEIAGNHESYYRMSIKDTDGSLDKWKSYTRSNGLAYTVSNEEIAILNNDLFIFIGQPQESKPMHDDDLEWLYGVLETNTNKRCFIFVHPHINSGNPLGVYTTNNFFVGWGEKTTAFKNLLSRYKNTILFHGHSHFMFECQEYDKKANYSENGDSENDDFKSIHVPSLSKPCAIVNGKRTQQDDKSQGYIVDVYDDCIVLNGMAFDYTDNTVVPVPLGTFKIDTTL